MKFKRLKKHILDYKMWMQDIFGMSAIYINSWQNDKLYRVEEIKLDKYNFSIEHKKHTSNSYCKSPFYHVHITWNGEVTYCTDFYDFSAGNVKEESLKDIFYNDKSLKFLEQIMNNNCSACSHCSWRNTDFI